MASSDYLQQAELFSSMDEMVKSESPESTSCVPINETPSPSEGGKEEPYICPRCEDIDLPNMFSQNPQEQVPIQHRSLDDLDPECGICRLLRVSWPRDDAKPPFFLTSWPDLRMIHRECSLAMPETANSRVVNISTSQLSWSRSYRSQIIIEVPLDALNTLTAAKIDFKILKSWIEDCSHNHGPECAERWERNHIPGLRLIKIKERRIVNASQEVGPYAALSYVWGTGPQGSPQGDKLPAKMPKTIVDAMSVALELDLEYLWVDRYCIQQDDPEKKKDQINKMHLIFRQSHVTIAAAAGDGPDHGIPGVGIPRIPQAYTIINGRLFVGVMRSPQCDAIPKSKWHTRAWTYQEEVLSRRIIYFTDSQSLFHCNQTYYPGSRLFEDFSDFEIEDPVRNMANAEDRRLCRDLEIMPRKKLGYEGWLIPHIDQLSKREITYENDRVNAIAGVLGQLQDKGQIVGHISGSPILCESFPSYPTYMTWEEGFLSGVVSFSNDLEGGRRNEFPSWSWAGWNRWYRNYPFIRSDNIRIWFEIDTTTATIFDLLEGMLNPRVPGSDNSKVCLSSRTFQARLEFENTLCRFIQIEAPIVHCQLERADEDWVVTAVEGYQLAKMISNVVHVGSAFDEPSKLSEVDRELLSKPLKGLLMKGEHIGFCGAYVMLLKEFDDYYERLGRWMTFSERLPFVPRVRDEDGSIIPLFEYGRLSEKPETEVLLKKEIIRLG